MLGTAARRKRRLVGGLMGAVLGGSAFSAAQHEDSSPQQESLRAATTTTRRKTARCETDTGGQQQQLGAAAAPSSMDDFCARFKALAAEPGGFQKEYRRARALADHLPDHRDRITPTTRVVSSRNRYMDIMTFDDTRVHLGQSLDGTTVVDYEYELEDYINASRILYNNSGPQTICAQGPMQSTSGHFWQMCLEQDVALVIMLTEFDAPHPGMPMTSIEKCYRYLPLEVGKKLMFGKILLECTSLSTPHPGWTERTIVVENQSNSVRRGIRHIHCTEWPDYDVLDVAHVEGLRWSLDLMNEERAKGHGPAVVHCSAGIGRSGTFVAIDQLLYNASRGDWANVDVCKVVASLRQQRPLMVQTAHQYEMVYYITALLLGCDVSFYQPSDQSPDL